ncbi:MAG: amidohydrolase family protein [Polyangiaceae bacterium]|nr:amidohydrolase family protein [Polyangiaceae bacterium]
MPSPRRRIALCRVCLSIAVVLCLMGCSPPAQAPASRPEPRTIAFVDVSVVPMDRERILPHMTVLVSGGRITAVSPAGDVEVPASAERIDGRGRYLIPGLTDAHVHLVSITDLDLYLANGVTTVFNLHGAPAHLRWRTWVEEGKRPGPTIYTTGPSFAAVRSPEEAVRLVDEQAAAGYDGIKIYNQVSREEYPALVAEAKRKRLLLMGHVARAPGFEATLRSGQAIAHAEELTYTFFNPRGDDDDAHIVYDEAKIPDAARMTAAAGVFVVATISMYRDIVRQATELDRYLQNPELEYLPPWIRAGLAPGRNRYSNRYSPEAVERLRISFGFQRKLIRAFEDAGVPLMTGTDATSIGPVAGFSMHEELLELVNSGLTPFQALRAATVSPARYFGRADGSGTITAGARADLVLLSADPLADIRSTRRVAGVMARGRWFDAAALKARLDAIRPACEQDLRSVARELGSDPRRAARYLAENDPLGKLGEAVLADVARRQGVPELRRLLRRVRQTAPDLDIAGEDMVNNLGYTLLAEGDAQRAIDVFIANVEDFPRSANAFDSLGEAYAKAGDMARAVQSYGKALEVDPRYPNAELARRFLAEHGAKP